MNKIPQVSICVAGFGSIGSLLAHQFKPFFDCSVLQSQNAHVNPLISSLTTFSGEKRVDTFPIHGASDGIVDVLILCCKAMYTQSILDYAEALIGPETQIVLLQNGMGQHDEVVERFQDNDVFAASSTEGAYRIGRYETIHAGQGRTLWGAYNQAAHPLRLPVDQIPDHELHTNIKHILAEKLAVNAVINPLTVKYNCHNGELLKDTAALSDMQQLSEETTEILKSEGHELGFVLYERAQAICTSTAGNISSMLQDVRNQRLTENAYINGYLLNKARNRNIAASLTQTLVNTIRSAEAAFPEP